jgi:hypothetical protein
MEWYVNALNPKSITGLFQKVPNLLAVEILELALKRDAALLLCVIRLPQFPTNPPAKWKISQFNAAVMKLQFVSVEKFELVGWSQDPVGDVSIAKVNKVIHFKIIGPTLKLHSTCGFFRIDGISGYVDSRSLT